MTWTKERPTQAGWYWVRWCNEPHIGPEIVLIDEPNGPDSGWFEVNDMPLDTYISNYGPMEWQGPIEPEEG